MSCKPLRIEHPTHCQEGFSGIGGQCLIVDEELKELIQSGKVRVVKTQKGLRLEPVKEETK